jgi:hypothetical protein
MRIFVFGSAIRGGCDGAGVIQTEYCRFPLVIKELISKLSPG